MRRMPTAIRATAPSNKSPSGRFGVTSLYLDPSPRTADQNGARRKTGRRRPTARAGKVYPPSRKVRNVTPGVGLHFAASPSRHLFHRGSGRADPRPEERSEPSRAHQRQTRRRGQAGVGTVAAGVAKAHADVGLDQRSRWRHRSVALKQASNMPGIPWELGLAENPPDAFTEQPPQPDRRRDGWASSKPGRDVVVAALLGAPRNSASPPRHSSPSAAS